MSKQHLEAPQRGEAYAAAEERLLDILSPLAEHAGPYENVNQAYEQEEEQHQAVVDQERDVEESVDPAFDNMMHFITNDSDIHSLISSSDSAGFKGWEDSADYNELVGDGQGHLIYGVCRNVLVNDRDDHANIPDTAGDQYVEYRDSTPSKRVHHLSNEIIEIDDSPETARESAMALFQAVANSQGMLTNGQDHHLVEEIEMVSHSQENGDHHLADGTECVIYDENMVVLTTEEHCCEIIVTTHGVASEQEMARAFLMSGNGIAPGSGPASAMLNGRVYITEEETHVEMQTDGNDIYLSDAALGQSIMLQHQHQSNELVVTEEDVEDPTFVDDQPLEEERPDICQVYDHELEDHDDEELEAEQIHEGQHQQEVGQFSMEWQMHQQQEQDQQQHGQDQQHGQEQQHEHEQQPILIASDVEDEAEEQQLPHMQQQPLHFPFKEQESERSSPTEFPVSSSSPPNGSDRDDDLDDDMAGHPSPAPRKYPPLLKNTLFAEAMDRRLAYICQTQPQMSLTEKVFAWDTAFAHDCEGVEDVENFQAAFEQLEPHKEHNFLTFRESLERNLKRISRDIMHMDEEVAIPTPSKRVQERLKPQRRLLHHPIPAEDTIILDDDDEDCYEVTGGGKDKSSITTLIPEEELECEDPNSPSQYEAVEPEVKTTQTQTAVNLVTKETSTTDLINCQEMMPPPAESAEVAEAQALSTFQTGHEFCEMVRDVFRGVRHQQYMEQHKQFQQQQLQQQQHLQQQQQLQHQQQHEMQHYQEHHQQEFEQQQKLQHYQELQEHHHQHQQHFHQIPRHQQYQPQYVPEMPENPAMVTTNQSSASYGDYPNDAMFYEQQEFCNYLGLTELATANAVASAMRELANSTVARRSLRVRPQHQLDRMRNDVRGKHRRERQEKDKDKDKKLNSNHHHPMTTISELSNDRNDNSAIPTTSEVTITAPNENSDEADKVAVEEEPQDQQQTTQSYDYYYQAQGDRSEGGAVKPIEETVASSSNNIRHTMESAFAKVYAAAPPAQLLEDMQRRLREAREAQPSIYIVQAMNNNATGKERKSTNSTEAVTFGEINGPRPSLESTKPASLPPPQQAPQQPLQQSKKKSGPAPRSKRTKSQYHHHVEAKVQSNAPIRRRRTTVGGGAAHNVRDLVTRSTTHMNSKLLRNRKINLLKTYALTDATGPNGKKKRLSGGGGGSTGIKPIKITKAATKTTTPKTSPSKNPSVDLQEKSSLPVQHRLQQQQSPVVVPPNSPKKSKNKAVVITEGPNVTAADRLSITPTKDKHMKSHKLNARRGRAKSLPAALSNKEIEDPLQQEQPQETQKEVQPMPDKQKSPIVMDTHEFLTRAVVHPPVWNEVTRRYAHHISQANSRAEAETEETGGSVYARLEKPPSIYEHPYQLNRRSPHPTEEPHFSRRSRQQAGTGHRHNQQQSDSGLYPFNINLTPPGGLLRLSEASSLLRNPLAGKNGKVLYMYYELDQLIVLQERSITFWKYCQLFNVLSTPATTPTSDGPRTKSPQGDQRNCDSDHSSIASQRQPTGPHWVNLGRLRRTTNDIEIVAPFGNRLCVHNSTPVYIEMRCHPLDHHRREGKLMSLYVNVYYYCEEELRPKMHSVHLDAVNCEWSNVIYTSIAESRYFVMAHQAEMMMGKSKSGICKYSLTPTLDTLASIREFKQLRHELKHIECLTEDRLIGYGVSRITIWDHRSGDTLMNYDLNMPLGRNLGAMHFPSFEMDQSSILILYQYIQVPTKPSQLHVIACEISHATPSHRLLHVHSLPSPQFDQIVMSVNTGDHLILKSITDDEIWLSAADPRQLTYVAPQGQGIQRFYARQKSQVVELSPRSLTVDSIANHFMKLATQQQQMAMILQSVNSLPVSPSPV